MALRDEIVPYVDGNQLVAPALVTPGTQKASDNGPMFTSEWYAMLKKSGCLVSQDFADFQERIGQCVNPQGMLCRVPVGQDDGQEQVDDYYGTLNGCKQMGNTTIPRQYLVAMIKNLGFMDNVNPGSHSNWKSFMLRQPQLVGAMIAAAFPSWWNPLHILIRMLFSPFLYVAALTLLISCINAPASDTDARRLSWHLMQTTKGVSLMCWLASKVWLSRLYKDFPDGMIGVAKLYYQAGHPFAKYWITE